MVKKVWFLPTEVVIHNKPDDCWVTLNQKVLDLTGVIQDCVLNCKCGIVCECAKQTFECECDADNCECKKIDIDKTCKAYCPCFCEKCFCNMKRTIRLIMAFAGKDISSWFKPGTNEFKIYQHAVAFQPYFLTQHGRLHNQHVLVPTTRWRPTIEKPWWDDDRIVIGRLTNNVRPIKITNTLTSSWAIINVCEEETIEDIMQHRYGNTVNRHYSSYTWRYMGRKLCHKQTLTQNRIPDERHMFLGLGLNEDIYVPNIQLYFNDDFTDDFDVDVARIPCVPPPPSVESGITNSEAALDENSLLNE